MQMDTLESQCLHSLPAAARLLGGVSVSLIRKWLSQGRLTRVKVGSRTMVRESELWALVKQTKGGIL
jgi:excisionase family DNA binding protein